MDENEDEILKKHLREIGRRGGRVRSPEKTEAVRANAKLPRRKRIPDEELTDAQRRRRERDAARRDKKKEE